MQYLTIKAGSIIYARVAKIRGISVTKYVNNLMFRGEESNGIFILQHHLRTSIYNMNDMSVQAKGRALCNSRHHYLDKA